MTYINCESWPEVEKTKNKDIVSFTNRVFNDNCVDECDTVDDIVYDKDVEFLLEKGHEPDYDNDFDFETSDSEENFPLSEKEEESFKDNNETNHNIDIYERLDYYMNLINEINNCDKCTYLNCDIHHISDNTLLDFFELDFVRL